MLGHPAVKATSLHRDRYIELYAQYTLGGAGVTRPGVKPSCGAMAASAAVEACNRARSVMNHIDREHDEFAFAQPDRTNHLSMRRSWR